MFECEDPHNECPLGFQDTNYADDLNAMHVVEGELNLNEVDAYNQELARTAGVLGGIFSKTGPEGWVFHATARQRAEAFLRVRKAWPETATI